MQTFALRYNAPRNDQVIHDVAFESEVHCAVTKQPDEQLEHLGMLPSASSLGLIVSEYAL